MDPIRRIKNIIETNQNIAKIFDYIAGTTIYRKYIYYRINKYIENIKVAKNYNIIIETTNYCNAKCIMCPHRIMKREQGVMNDEIFDLIIAKIINENIKPKVFILNGFGEPLTDKNILIRIQKIKNNFPNSIIKFYSNFELANEDIINNIINSGLDEINISFNGFKKESYERVMGINYDKTMDNIYKLVDARNKLGSNLKIRISMVLTSDNDRDEHNFIKQWENVVNSVSVNKIHTYNNSINNVSGINKINYNKLTYPCKYIFNTIVFDIHGNISLCCLDYEIKYNFGNILDSNILDIFYCKEFEEIRKKHLENDIKSIDICKECYTPYKNGVEWLINDLY